MGLNLRSILGLDIGVIFGFKIPGGKRAVAEPLLVLIHSPKLEKVLPHEQYLTSVKK